MLHALLGHPFRKLTNEPNGYKLTVCSLHYLCRCRPNNWPKLCSDTPLSTSRNTSCTNQSIKSKHSRQTFYSATMVQVTTNKSQQQFPFELLGSIQRRLSWWTVGIRLPILWAGEKKKRSKGVRINCRACSD